MEGFYRFSSLILVPIYKRFDPGSLTGLHTRCGLPFIFVALLSVMVTSCPRKHPLETETYCFHFQRRILDGSLGFAAGVSASGSKNVNEDMFILTFLCQGVSPSLPRQLGCSL